MLTSWASPLVGREDCVEALTRALGWAVDGNFAVVEVSGEPGIGKTRVLAEASSLANASGLAVFSGHATQFEREVPLALFTEALRPTKAADPSPLDVLLPGSAHEPLGPPVDQVRIYAAVRRHLMESAVGGTALILDDLHWADQTSLELTEYLIRRPPPAPVLMVVAFRSARPPVRIVDAITRAGSGAWRIRLEPLTATDLQVLVPDVAHRRRDLLMRASRGNPLYIQALGRLTDTTLSELVREHEARSADWVDESTRPILRALAVDLATLAESAQRVAHAIAVIGDHAAVDLVAHVSGLPVSTVVDALDLLCGTGLGDMDGAWFRFHHPLMRAAAHDMAGPVWRLQAHARAAEYLRSHDGPLLLLAHHVERSAQYGNETAARTLLNAGESVVYRAPGTAVRWLGKALRILSPTSPLLEQRPAVLLQYARALGLAGELGRSWVMLQELLRDGHPCRAEAAAFGLVIARLRGDLDTASALLNGELRRARCQPAVEGKLQVQLAALAALREDATAAMDHAHRALHLLGGHRPVLAAAAQALRAWGALYVGQPAKARTYAREAALLVDTVSDVTLGPHVELLGPLAWVEMRLGDLTAASRHLVRAHEVVEQAGHSSAQPYLLVVDAALKSRLGRLESALHLSEQAVLAADRMGSREMGTMADAVRLQPLLWTAGPAAVITVAQQLAALERPRSQMWWRVAQLNLAIAHAVAEDGKTCLDLLTNPHMAWPADPLIAVTRQVALAQGLACSDDLDAAFLAAEDAEKIALAAGLDYELGLAWYAKAYVATRAGKFDRATTLANESAAKFAVSKAAIEEARARHLAGIAYSLAGQPERGQEEFGRAKSSYVACDATWLVSTVARDQRRCAARLSRRSRTAMVTNVDILTSRERQVSDLVAAGLTNQEIATQLFLSRRTVESHLSRIFSKLNVRSRAAMVRRLSQ